MGNAGFISSTVVQVPSHAAIAMTVFNYFWNNPQQATACHGNPEVDGNREIEAASAPTNSNLQPQNRNTLSPKT